MSSEGKKGGEEEKPKLAAYKDPLEPPTQAEGTSS